VITEDALFSGIRELGARLRARQFTPVELAELALRRLETIGPKLGAVATLTRERALREAHRANQELLRGKDRGPLHGIPYGLKDLVAAKGAPTSWGALPLREQTIDVDATVTKRLEQAGAVLVAKLAMVELAGGMGYNSPDASFTGPGRTPWNRDYWSGGSSSGSAAAVAAGLVAFAIGSETSGSILTPSAVLRRDGAAAELRARLAPRGDGARLDARQAGADRAERLRLRDRARGDRRPRPGRPDDERRQASATRRPPASPRGASDWACSGTPRSSRTPTSSAASSRPWRRSTSSPTSRRTSRSPTARTATPCASSSRPRVLRRCAS
jgi:hypothetical protein